MPQTMIIPFNDQEIGQGFNSQTRESLGKALVVPTISDDKVADGQDVFTSFEIVSDQTSLMQALGVSASMGARYMLFSADAKVSFAESSAVNSFSSFVVGRCLVKNAQRKGHGFKLTEDAQTLLHKPSGMEDFKTAFGDVFVRALNTGGEFLVIARITSISQEHQNTLATSLRGEYNGFTVAVSFNAALTKAMSETNNHTDVTVWLRQRGGQEAQVTFTGADAMKILERLANFPTIAHQHPVGYEADLASYNTIPIPIPTAEEREDQALVLLDCAQQKLDFLKALSDLAMASDPRTSILFDDLPPPDELNRMKGQYRTALNALFSHAILVATGHMDPPQNFVANPAPPAINFKKKPFAPPPPPVPVPSPAQVQIPRFDGSVSLSQAIQTLNQLGLVAQTQPEDISFDVYRLITQHTFHGPDHTTEIMETIPAAGQMVAPGSTVIIRVPGQVIGHPEIVIHFS